MPILGQLMLYLRGVRNSYIGVMGTWRLNCQIARPKPRLETRFCRKSDQEAHLWHVIQPFTNSPIAYFYMILCIYIHIYLHNNIYIIIFTYIYIYLHIFTYHIICIYIIYSIYVYIYVKTAYKSKFSWFFSNGSRSSLAFIPSFLRKAKQGRGSDIMAILWQSSWGKLW